MDVYDLPAVNASLNATAAGLLIWGYTLIRRRKIESHRKVMIAAFVTSVLFLISYLVYHARVRSVPFGRTGWISILYYCILITHAVLAAAVPPLAIITLRRAFRADFARHHRIAVWTFPIWLYVSVTGVVVYWMLYRM